MRPHTSYLAEIYWLPEDGIRRLKQLFLYEKEAIFAFAKKFAKGKNEVSLYLVAMHYDRNAYNDHSKHYWYDYKDGEFIDVTNKYK